MSVDNSAATADDLAAVGQGDAAAFARLYDATASRVYGLARLIVDEQRAADATVTTFDQVWRTAPSFDPAADNAEQWVLQIAHRAAVEQRREHAAVHRWGAAPQATPGGDRHLPLDELPGPQRTALALVYFRGHCCADVARMMGMSNTVLRELLMAGLLALRAAP